jgi:hypothetical protein
MRDQYIFDIPVYRLTSDEFDAEIELRLAKRVKWLCSYDPQRRPLSPKRKDQQLHSIIADSGGPWQFNQVIGWLRLYLSTFSDVLGAWFPKESSSEIFATLLKRLSEMAGERPYANRYIDFDVFRRLGPVVDWRGIVDQPASKKIDSNRRTK